MINNNHKETMDSHRFIWSDKIFITTAFEIFERRDSLETFLSHWLVAVMICFFSISLIIMYVSCPKIGNQTKETLNWLLPITFLNSCATMCHWMLKFWNSWICPIKLFFIVCLSFKSWIWSHTHPRKPFS